MKLFVIGYFGSGNLGDEAVLQAFVEWSRANLPGAGITVMSARPEITKSVYNVNAVGKKRLLKLIGAVRSHDAIIAPGGTILQDATSLRSLLYYAALIRLAKFFGKKAYFLNQGVGPLRRGISRRLTGKIASGWAELFTLRDGESARLLVQLGVQWKQLTVRGDTSCLLARRLAVRGKDAARTAKKLKVGISLRPHPETGQFIKTLLYVLSQIAREDIVMRALPFQMDEDEQPCKDFAREWGRTCADIPMLTGWKTPSEAAPTPLEALNVVQGLDLMIGMRLHSLIFAGMCGIPFVGVSYDPKVSSFCEATGQPCYVLTGEDRRGELRDKLREALQAAASPAGAHPSTSHMKTQILIQTRALSAGMDEFKRALQQT